jgi:superfamily I DNA and/or RNA helicase
VALNTINQTINQTKPKRVNIALIMSLLLYLSCDCFVSNCNLQNPEICEFPSKQFYKNKLETMPSLTWLTDHPLSSWVRPGIPVVFCHVEGTEDYLPFNTDEGNQQSCSNKQEVDQVVGVI